MQDVDWMQPDGGPMDDEDWNSGHLLALMFFLNGQVIPTPDERGRRVQDDSFLVLLNSSPDTVTFTMPAEEFGKSWQVMVDTENPASATRGRGRELTTGDTIELVPRSSLLIQRLDDARDG